MEQTLVIIKPDALARGLVGTAIRRLEQIGLKMVACKMLKANKKLIEKMYKVHDKEYIHQLGLKTIKTYEEFGANVKEQLGTDDPDKLGADIANYFEEYIQSGPVIATVWEGTKAVSVVRKIRGATSPLSAEVGSFVGDFSHDSQFSAPLKKRVIKNLLHASGTVEEAKDEIALWFGKDFKPLEYDRADSIFF